MRAGGGQAEEDVARPDAGFRQKSAALDGADRKAGEIIIGAGVKARHFGGLAADQRRAGLEAARRDALDDGARDRAVEPAGRVIIEEEQGLGALHDEIVDAHGDEVDADRVVESRFDRDFDLGADAVIGGDEDADR